jgi:hypothetical protein
VNTRSPQMLFNKLFFLERSVATLLRRASIKRLYTPAINHFGSYFMEVCPFQIVEAATSPAIVISVVNSAQSRRQKSHQFVSQRIRCFNFSSSKCNKNTINERESQQSNAVDSVIAPPPAPSPHFFSPSCHRSSSHTFISHLTRLNRLQRSTSHFHCRPTRLIPDILQPQSCRKQPDASSPSAWQPSRRVPRPTISSRRSLQTTLPVF